jgi:hypothetical protein
MTTTDDKAATRVSAAYLAGDRAGASRAIKWAAEVALLVLALAGGVAYYVGHFQLYARLATEVFLR